MRPARASHGARFLALGILLGTTGCGDDDDDGDRADGGDVADDADDAGDDDGGDDSAGTCGAWQLEPAEADIEFLTAEPGPYNPDKTMRVRIGSQLAACERRAIPRITVSEADTTVTIDLLVWRQVDGDCADPGGGVSHAIPLRLPRAGAWTITAGGKSIEIEVDAAPDRACGIEPGQPCAMDCDCGDEQLRCLSGSGLAGPFTECARPCELDRDCGGQGTCQTIADGLSFACVGDAECGATAADCPGGWSCSDDVCEPDFALGAAARVECDCDADCAEPLRCVRAAEGEPGRCEIQCQTDGPWCEGAHACGTAEMDAAGLAATDSVCVFLGE